MSVSHTRLLWPVYTSAWINMEFTIARSDLVQYFSAIFYRNSRSGEINFRGAVGNAYVPHPQPLYNSLQSVYREDRPTVQYMHYVHIYVVCSVLWYGLRCVDHTLCFVCLQERIQHSSGHKVWLISVWPLFTATCTCS